MSPIDQFVKRCDRFCEASGRSRTWLSKRLFDTTDRIADLADGKSDVTTKILERAKGQLRGLERSLKSAQSRGEAA
jgi:hypothetical protein